MESIPDIYSLLAELAIALAGFSGVSSTFAGRERLFRPMERTRLQAVLLSSSSVLAGCLALYSASSVGLDEAESASVSAAVGIVFTVPNLAFLIPTALRHRKDSDSTTEIWVIYTVSLYSLALLALLGIIAAQKGDPNLLVVGFSSQLLFGLWMFVRLLTRPN
ncbi:MAG: hypothetical protein IH881_16905 [Myxococcales bacterium]|nr:hypothetical protein [Myxococcales bacterium]